MNYKYIIKISSKMLLLFIVLTMLIASLDGIVLSAVISEVTHFDSNSSVKDIIFFSMTSLVSYILVMLSGQLNTILKNKLLRELNIKIKDKYIKNRLESYPFSLDSSEIVSFLLNDFKLVESNYINVLFDVCYYVVTGVVSMAYLLYLNPIIATLFIIFSFLPMLPPRLFSQSLERKSREWSSSNENFTSTLKSLISGRRTLKTYNGYVFSSREVADKLYKNEKMNESFKNSQSFVGFVAAVLSWVSYIIPITCALYLVIHKQLEAGAVVAIFLASDRVIYPLRNVSMLMNQINTTKEARKKIYDVIQRDSIDQGGHQLSTPKLVIKEMSFSFETKTIFDNVDMTFEFGKHYLISGPSGSGKSTFLDLLQGLLLPQKGRVFITDSTLSSENLESQVARINQHPTLFQASIRDNLALGKPITDVEMVSVLGELGLINELGNDILDTVYNEKTMDLSGGQKQRLEIARAILHKKPIILVDEGTAALDSKNSTIVRDKLYSLPATIIEVAHHFTEEEIQKYSLTHICLKNKTLAKAD
ncbi:ATP-binding cassette domain-containing protein [Streptococcus marmotae]|uniref:ATP-binding cassette domain-containing protein n=1 Tax=Streptococcus marmotae TaxID=1825069 RepID=UPI00082CB853|nr:ABC transporter ATP-binding protein [Streptococcus marmotae]